MRPRASTGSLVRACPVSHMLAFRMRPEVWHRHVACLARSPLSECCGALEYYDKAFDRITTRSEKPLRSIKRIFHTVTTTDDPVIRKVGPRPGPRGCM